MKNIAIKIHRNCEKLRHLVDIVEHRGKELEDMAKEINNKLESRGYWIDWRYVNGHGPYACLRWWEDGKKRAKYLGKKPRLKALEVPEKEKKSLERMMENIQKEAGELNKAVEKAIFLLEGMIRLQKA